MSIVNRVIIQGEINGISYQLGSIISSNSSRGVSSSLNSSIESISIPLFKNLPDTTILFIDSLATSHNIDLSSVTLTTALFADLITDNLTAVDTGGETYTSSISLTDEITFTSTSTDWSINMQNSYWEQRSGLSGLQETTTNSIITTPCVFASQLVLVETNLCSGTIISSLSYPTSNISRLCNNTSTFSLVVPLVIKENNIYSKYFGEFGTKFRIQHSVSNLQISLYDELRFPIITSPQRWYITFVLSE